MTKPMPREERETYIAQLAEIEQQIDALAETLQDFDGPIVVGQSKEHVKGLLEQQLANLERQRDDLRMKLGCD